MTRATALVCVLGCLAACTEYKVRVHFTPAATDQRLASGKSDTVDGKLRRGDATNIYIDADGQLEAIPRAEVASVDDYYAKRDVRNGTLGLIAGGVITLGSLLFFDCDEDYGPLCVFTSKRNFYSGLAFVGGLAISGMSLKILFSGMGGTSHTDDVMRSASRWQVAPIVVQGEHSMAPGVGVSLGY